MRCARMLSYAEYRVQSVNADIHALAMCLTAATGRRVALRCPAMSLAVSCACPALGVQLQVVLCSASCLLLLLGC
jgi:hypothetical protein